MVRRVCRTRGAQTGKQEQEKRDELRHANNRKAGMRKTPNTLPLLFFFFLLPPTCSLSSHVTSPQDVKTPPATRLYPSSPPPLVYRYLFPWRLPFYCHPSSYLSPLLPRFFMSHHFLLASSSSYRRCKRSKRKGGEGGEMWMRENKVMAPQWSENRLRGESE